MANEFLKQRVATMTYSFTDDGGAVSTITPKVTASIPVGAIITNIILEGATTTDAGGAGEIAITGGGVTLVGAQTLATNVVDGTAITSILRAGAIRTAEYLPIKATSTAPLKVVVSVEAITGGGFTAYVEYLA